MPDDEINRDEIEEKEICVLNLFFGIIIVVSSILIFISFFMVNDNTQIITISFNLFLVGVAFTGIGVPDKEQGVKAATLEIWGGFIITIAGLTCFSISLITSILMNFILLMIYLITIIAGVVAFGAAISERETRTWSKWIMAGSGIAMAGSALLYFVLVILDMVGIITINIDDLVNFMNIPLSISILLHGFARISIYYTGVYIKTKNP